MQIEISINNSINQELKKLKDGDTLILNDGIYNEKVEVWNNNITIVAKNKHKAIISNMDYYHKIMPDNNECNTFRTYTLYVGGNNVLLKDLVIENRSTPSSIYGQAVSLHVDGNNFICSECIIKSAQDTLFTGPLPKDLLKRYENFYPKEKLKGNPSKQKYINCQIIGDVDFIFGCATALFENCEIISLDRNSNSPSYICAPAHDKNTIYGYLFYNCHLIGNNPTFLARPWRDYGNAAFINCILDNHIIPEGFNKWNGTQRDRTAKFYEYSKYYTNNDRVSWSKQMTFDEAEEFVTKFKEYLNL